MEGLLRLNRRKVRQNPGQAHRPLAAPSSGYNDCHPTVGPPHGWTGAIHRKRRWALRGRRRICCPKDFGEENIGFALEEILDRKAHTPTEQEAARHKRDYWWSPPKWDYQPTGPLRVCLLNGETTGARR